MLGLSGWVVVFTVAPLIMATVVWFRTQRAGRVLAVVMIGALLVAIAATNGGLLQQFGTSVGNGIQAILDTIIP